MLTDCSSHVGIVRQWRSVDTVDGHHLEFQGAQRSRAECHRLDTRDGRRESTDSGEWMTFQNQSGVNWSVLNNSPNNPYRNACYNDNTSQIPSNDTTNSGFLAYTAKTQPTVGKPVPVGDTSTITLGAQGQTGTTSVLCESDQQLNKTGTLMLSATVPTNSLHRRASPCR